jgi:hypothetical protein
MFVDSIEKWITNPRFTIKYSHESVFYATEKVILCKSCRWFYYERENIKNKNKPQIFCDVSVNPKNLHSLFMHITSDKHKTGYRNFIKHFMNKTPNENYSSLTKNSKFKKKEKIENKNSDFKKYNFEKRNYTKPNLLFEAIKTNFRIIYWMVKSNLPINKLISLQSLVHSVSNNFFLNEFHHNSTHSYLEHLSILNINHKNILINTINTTELFSILVDDTVDINKEKQMSVYLRYTDENIKVKTSFLCLRKIGHEGANVKNLFQILISVLEDFKLPVKNLVSLCTDGAANMRGENVVYTV